VCVCLLHSAADLHCCVNKPIHTLLLPHDVPGIGCTYGHQFGDRHCADNEQGQNHQPHQRLHPNACMDRIHDHIDPTSSSQHVSNCSSTFSQRTHVSVIAHHSDPALQTGGMKVLKDVILWGLGYVGAPRGPCSSTSTSFCGLTGSAIVQPLMQHSHSATAPCSTQKRYFPRKRCERGCSQLLAQPALGSEVGD
jgi:hypothetical protein